jgi:hypothetical protein
MREILIAALCLLFAYGVSNLEVPAHAAVWTDQSVPASPASLDCTHVNGQSGTCWE